MATEIARLIMAVDSSQVRGATRDLQGMSGAAGSLGKMLGGLAIGGTLAAMAKHVFTTTSQFQQLHNQLVTVTGSAMLAGAAFQDLQAFAAKTPFELSEVTQAYVKLRAMGLEPSMDAMKAWGDLARANGKGILDTIQAVANATMGEAEMLKQYGIKMKQNGDRVTFIYRGLATTVRNTSEDIEGHLLKLAQTNFGNAMARDMDTLDGAMSNLRDSADRMAVAFGKAFADQTVGGIQAFSGIVDDLTPSVAALATEIAGLTADLAALTKEAKSALEPLSPIIKVGMKAGKFGRAALADSSTAALRTMWGGAQAMGDFYMGDYSLSSLKGTASGFSQDPRTVGVAKDWRKGAMYPGMDQDFETLFKRVSDNAAKFAPVMEQTATATNMVKDATSSWVMSLKDEIATLGLTETQLLRYKAAQLGLSGNKEVQALIARKEAWNLEEKAIEDTVAALEDYAAKAKALGGSDTEKVLGEMAAFGPEAARGLMEYSRTLDEITDQYADLRQMSLYWQQDFTDALVEMTFTGKNLWRDMVDSMLRDLARLAVQKNVTSPLFAWLGKIDWASVFGGGSSAYKTATAGEWWEEAFPTGKIANPSGMGGTMPMKAGPIGGAPMVNVAITVDQSGQVSSSADGPGAVQWQRSIKAMMDRWAQDEMRSGGLLSRKGSR